MLKSMKVITSIFSLIIGMGIGTPVNKILLRDDHCNGFTNHSDISNLTMVFLQILDGL